MMKRFLLIISLMSVTASNLYADVALDEKYFPDAALRGILSDYAMDGVLSDERIADITSLTISSDVESLQGLSLLTSLETLWLHSAKPALLDASNYPSSLVNLIINDATVTEISVDGLGTVKNLRLTQCTSLVKLECKNAVSLGTIADEYGSIVEDVDVSGCVNLGNLPEEWQGWRSHLKRLNISGTAVHQFNLDSWEVSMYGNGNGAMTEIVADNCPVLSSIIYAGKSWSGTPDAVLGKASFRNCPQLKDLSLSYCALTSFDIEGSDNIERLNLKANRIAGTLDFSHLNQLRWLNISDDDTYLNSSSKKDSPFALEGFVLGIAPIETLYCQGNFTNMEKLDMSNCQTLKELYCGGYSSKTLKEVDVSGCANLQILDCAKGKVEKVCADNCSQLTTLRAGHAKLNTLSLYRCENLQVLDIEEHSVKELDLTWCKESLTELKARNGKLESLDVANFRNLTLLSCYDNPLTRVDATNCSALTELTLDDCSQLAEVKVSGCAAMQRIYLDSNFALESLDVSGLSNLTSLSIRAFRNPYTDKQGVLRTLNLTGCSSLVSLNCAYNQLEQLDLSDVSDNMYNLQCNNNCLAYVAGTEHLSNPYKNFLMGSNVHTVVSASKNVNLLEVAPSFNMSIISNIIGGEIVNHNFMRFNEAAVTYTLDYGLNANPTGYGLPTVNPTFTIRFMKDEDIPIDEAHFPDPYFRRSLASKDTDEDGKLSPTERMIENFTITDGATYYTDGHKEIKYVTDISGIEYFPFIAELTIKCEKLEQVDCSYFPLLKEVVCSDSKSITTIDVSKNRQLMWLTCHNCSLQSIDLSQSPLLSRVACSGNPLMALNIYPNALNGEVVAENLVATVNVDADNHFDLFTVKNLMVDRIANVIGGSVSGNMLKFNSDELSYDYDTDGNGKFIHVTVKKSSSTAVSSLRKDTLNGVEQQFMPSGIPITKNQNYRGIRIQKGKKFIVN